MSSRRDRISGIIGLALAMLSPADAAAQSGEEREVDEIVDVELILAVDVSLSMSPMELAIQRDGYAAAFSDDRVIQAIVDGVHGSVAITYVEWAGDFVQQIIVPWTRISSAEEARHFASLLSATPPNRARRTSISGALAYTAGLFDENGFRGLKRVIDISGDGPNNQGPQVDLVRDDVVARGITVNGLPLMTTGGYTSAFDVRDLDLYYANCVIGGPGAFMIPVNDWTHFPEAVRRKLVLELAGTPDGPGPSLPESLPLVRVSADTEYYDCLIGEKMWLDRSRLWEN